MGKKRIAFVCQRYGLEINGGSELYCRLLAEKLVKSFDVTVYTTCAEDYLSWADSYRPGQEVINGVTVKRFRVACRRNRYLFAGVNRLLQAWRNHPAWTEWLWIDLQGPCCPDLIRTVTDEHGQYQAVLFMTYLYYTTVRGMIQGMNNAVLIPTIHDEPMAYFRCYEQVFARARAISWNTPEERAFARKRFPFIADVPEAMTGIGVEEPSANLHALPESIRGKQYLVYTGRIDKYKGCEEMFQFFQRFKRQNDGELKLVLMGKSVIPIPHHPDIISLGFVSETVKNAVMANAFALVLFSRYESLSMVVLESMILGRPVLVTGHCEVLKGHCQRSGAGIVFNNYQEFSTALNYLLSHPAEYSEMQEKGKKYVRDNYRWDEIIRKYTELINRSCNL